MNNQEIWDRFLFNNRQWKEAEFSGEKIALSFYQLKNVVEIAAKYARMDEKEEVEKARVTEEKIRNSAKNYQGAGSDIFNQVFGGGFGK